MALVSAAVMPNNAPVANANSTARRVPTDAWRRRCIATESTGAATAAHTSHAWVDAKFAPAVGPGQEQEGGQAGGQDARPARSRRGRGCRPDHQAPAGRAKRMPLVSTGCTTSSSPTPRASRLEHVADAVGRPVRPATSACGPAAAPGGPAADRAAPSDPASASGLTLLEHRTRRRRPAPLRAPTTRPPCRSGR